MEELTMMLIYLSSFTEDTPFPDVKLRRAWKGFNFDVLNKLDKDEYINQGRYKSKSLYLTKEGEKLAIDLLEKYNINDWEE